KDHALAAKVEKGEGKGCHRAQEQRTDDGDGGYENRIENEQAHRRTPECGRVVVQRYVTDREESVERGRVAQQLGVRLERADHHENNREDKDQRHQDQQQVFETGLEALVGRGDCSHDQRSRVTYRWNREMASTIRNSSTEMADPPAIFCCS